MNRSTVVRLVGAAALAIATAMSFGPSGSAAPEPDAGFGMAELSTLKSSLDRNSASVPKSVTGWRVDAATNSVVVSVLGQPSASVHDWVSSVDREAATAVRFERVAERPQPYWQIKGGEAIYFGGGRCSVGFNAQGGGARYVITAGHCTDLGGSVDGVGGSIGQVAGSSFPGDDYGIIEVTSGSAESTPLVSTYGGGDVTVVGSSEVPVGGTVCRSGSTTGWHCGTVLGRGETVCYAQGCVYDTIRTDVCAEPGDSGGSLVSEPDGSGRVHAQGMTSGGSGNCSSGGITYYQPVNEALSVYGLSLYTG